MNGTLECWQVFLSAPLPFRESEAMGECGEKACLGC